MKRFAHGLLGLVLLVVSTCTILRAEPHTYQEKAADACPLHSGHPDDSKPASQSCANCLSSHFVSESKVHFAVAVIAAPTPLPAIDLQTSATRAATAELSAATFRMDTSPPILRI